MLYAIPVYACGVVVLFFVLHSVLCECRVVFRVAFCVVWCRVVFLNFLIYTWKYLVVHCVVL